jgi:hypothetical protein
MGNRSGRAKQRKSTVNRRLIVEQLAERRVLAAITGAVFEDADFSMQQEVAEANLPRRLVYVDANDNAELDNGESFVVAEDDGTFEFPNLSDGSYLLRLFNGTQTQVQTTPIEATVEGDTVSVADALQLELGNGATLVLTDDSLVIGDLQDGSSRSIAVGNQLTKMQTLPDGKLLIIASGTTGDTSWVVDPVNDAVTPVDLSGVAQSTPWSDVEIDANGRGVLLEQSAGLSAVRSIDVSDSFSGVQVTTTTATVPADTQVITSDTGHRSVFGWSGSNGLELSLWSNVTDSFITTTPVATSGTSELLAFDDASGLLALRTSSGGVGVYDVDAGFAQLHSLDNVTGPVAIDGARDLLMTVSPLDAALRVINLRDGALIADLAIDLSSVGQVAAISSGSRPDAVVVLGAAGVTEVALRRPAAHQVTISGGQDSDPVLFGVALDGSNSAPEYLSLPNLETDQDQTLTLPAPTALNDSMDAEGDQYVIVQRSQAGNGTATLRIDGSISYTPDLDFTGSDSVQVILHDGRDASAEVSLQIAVNPLSGVIVTINPIPEGITPGEVVGEIQLLGDGGAREIHIDDPRFGEQGGDIIFIGGDIDFEQDPVIPLKITITDTDSGEVIEETIAVTIRDENEPIEDILPHEATLWEDSPGDGVAELLVLDPDFDQNYTFTVDDNRFVVENSYLKLVEGVSVDFETEQTIVVNVTASDSGGSFTQEITIEVLDVREQPMEIELSNQTVMELVPGDVVGEVILDGGTPSSEFSLSVDDSRFEIVGSTLKLLDDQFVERANQSEIELTITAQDLQGEFDSISQKFIIDVTENVTPYHNYDHPYDVDHNGVVSTLDALVIINYLNRFGPGPVGQGDPGFSYDVNADGFVTALDALLVLNEINHRRIGGDLVGEGDQTPEGEQIPIDEPGQPENLAEGEVDAEGERQPGDQLLDGGKDSNPTASRPDVTEGDPAEPMEIPSHSSSEKYAENVDQTLRLLSEGDV